jgi:hypothetical protein
MTTTITVENCASCPFRVYSVASGCECGIVYRDLKPSNPDPPDWCPLRTADRLVTLRVM